MKRTSTYYVTTLDPMSVVDMEKLQVIKATIRVANQYSKSKKRVVLRGRKPLIKKTVTSFRTGKTSVRSYDFGGNCVGGIKNASKYDIYIYSRR